MRCMGDVVRIGEVGMYKKLVVGRAEGKRPLGRAKYGCEGNIEKGIGVQTGFIRLGIGISGGLLWTISGRMKD